MIGVRSEEGRIEVRMYDFDELEPCDAPPARCAARFCATVTFSLEGSSVSVMPKTSRRVICAASKTGLKERVCGARTRCL